METIASLTEQIRDYDRKIEELCQEEYPEARLLQQITGVGRLTSLTYVLTLEDPDRFQKRRQVGPALGLVPRRDQSGDRDPQLRITTPSRPPCGKNAKKKAVVAVARKLAMLLRRLWKTGEVYDPFYQSREGDDPLTTAV